MTPFVALLRGINVGGHKQVAMTELRSLSESLGLVDVQTLLQSGNLVFKSKKLEASGIESLLEKETLRHFGHRIDFFVRNVDEWNEIVACNPFRDESIRDPGHLLVMCLRDVPGVHALTSLKAAIVGREYFQAKGRQLYLVYPDGIGRSRLTAALIEKKLDTRGTARNWNTVQKLVKTLSAAGE